MFSMQEQNQTFMMSSSPFSTSSQSSSFSLQSLSNSSTMMMKRKKSNNKEMKRRFSDEQIKSLEYSFESEPRPDSNVKHEIAGKLELQPRQVSIWFQNRRARLKSKQIEQEFGLLKSQYDSLASSFDSLKRENDLLIVQLQKLKSSIQNGSRNIEHHQHNKEESRINEEESSIIKSEPMDKSGFKATADDNNLNSRNGEEEGSAGLTEDQSAASACDDSLASNIIRFDSEYFLDESSCSSQWWELWS